MSEADRSAGVARGRDGIRGHRAHPETMSPDGWQSAEAERGTTPVAGAHPRGPLLREQCVAPELKRIKCCLHI